MIRKLSILFVLLLVSAFIFAQNNIEIRANNKALNQVLLQLRQQYDYQFSYSDNKLSKYKVTINQSFSSQDEAIKQLIKDLPLKLQKSGDVYIIIPDKKKEKQKEKEIPKTKITGQIVEAGSYEPLPFSHILINNQQLISDVMGSFNYVASADSSFHVQISHLGYYVFDTIVHNNIDHRFTLTPSSKDLPEVTVQNNVIEKATLVGQRSGNMKLNHTISRFIPGQGDNSVFNLMRLMPGIQAAGEQSNDLLIWGSYEGQSQITFDEFTIFGLKNYNDNISAVNPFLVKNIEIYKGGYEAKYGNRVGAIVNITGKYGNRQKPSLSINLNPTTINGLLEIPLFKKSTFMLAYRQTYYNLYNKEDFNIFAPTRPFNKSASTQNVDFDIDVYPDNYKFRDLNLKYTFQANNGDLFYISAYSGTDYFNLKVNTEIAREKIKQEGTINFDLTLSNIEENAQQGISANYSKKWKNGSSRLIAAHSNFSTIAADSVTSLNLTNNKERNNTRNNKTNQVVENTIKLENTFTLAKANQLQFGAGIVSNSTNLLRNKINTGVINIDTTTTQNNRAFLFIQDKFKIGSRLTVNTGFRLNIANNITKNILEPRINTTFKLTESIKASASAGIFNQFMYKIAIIDKDLNYNYQWLTVNENRPALKATHYTAALNYFKNDLTINVEGYYKTIDNIMEIRNEEIETRKGDITNRNIYYSGLAKTSGIDTYIKKDFGKNSVWASYTLSQAMQNLSSLANKTDVWEYAPHDQRHELKIAGIANYHNFYLSANYVYGSGMQIIKDIFENEIDNYSYKRLDIALTYTFNTQFMQGEAGLSILNILDTQNLKYANIKNVKIDNTMGTVRIYSDAVAFTPILFLKVAF